MLSSSTCPEDGISPLVSWSFLRLRFAVARNGTIFFIFVSLFLSLSAEKLCAEDKSLAVTLASLLRQSSVVIIGETHHKLESPSLVADVVESYLDAGGCLIVALEIASDQQPALDASVQGRGPLSEVVIHLIIDHPAYRDMLGRLRDLRQAGKCLKVRAIDSPRGETGPKDEWMAKEVQKLVASKPVLVLVGNLHALKNIQWESGQDDPYLAERLVRQGIMVVSVLQEWETGCDKRTGRLLDIQHPRAVAALRAIVSPVAARPYGTSEEVADYVLMWECNETEKWRAGRNGG